MSWEERDKENVWHPYTQHKLVDRHIPIVRAEGAYLYDENDQRYIDAISSWWVNTHGHAHPYIAEKVGEQLSILEHVIFAGFTHPPAVMLAERLLGKLPGQDKVFYSDNGSTAVEVAVKMALQFWSNRGEKRHKIVALSGAYHGDTFGAMSVSGRGEFTAPFDPFMFEVEHIDLPGSGGLEQLQSQLEKGEVAAFIFEPLVQGAAGMVMYPANELDKMIALCKSNDVLTIADEVMVGFGRTGKMFAMEHCRQRPDICCFSKGLTGGTMALGATTASNQIYEAFYSDDKLHTFFHGHSFTANPVACSAALASLDLFEKQETWTSIKVIEEAIEEFAKEIGTSERLADVRQTGTILAMEMKTGGDTSYFNELRDEMYNFFIDRGILLRPLGNVLYILPPYCLNKKDLDEVFSAIRDWLSR